MRVDFEVLSRSRLRVMSRAGEEVFDALRALGKAGANPVAQVLAHQGKFFEADHYPKGDVYDEETGSQYYYHAHRGQSGEHGHFHTFIRARGIPAAARPVAVRSAAKRPRGKAAICHLIAISMNRAGLPIGLFTTNQWVTGETLFSAQDTIQMLDRFQIDHVHPCLATNRALPCAQHRITSQQQRFDLGSEQPEHGADPSDKRNGEEGLRSLQPLCRKKVRARQGP
jgi:hypothetical protein